MASAVGACNLADMMEPGEPDLGNESSGDDILGGQTGDGTGFDQESQIALACGGTPRVEVVKLSSTDASRLPVDPEDLLALLREGVASTVAWDPYEALVISPLRAEAGLQLEFDTNVSELRWTHYDSPEEDSLPTCPPFVELDTVAHVVVGDDFDVEFPVIVKAERPSVARFVGTAPSAEVKSGLSVGLRAQDLELQAFDIVGTLSDYGAAGQVLVKFADASDEGALSRIGDAGAQVATDSVDVGEGPTAFPLLVWPGSDECGPPDSVALEASSQWLGEPVSHWLDVFDTTDPLALLWTDGTESSLSVELSGAGPACLSLFSDGPLGWSAERTLVAKSEDDRVMLDADVAVLVSDEHMGEASFQTWVALDGNESFWADLEVPEAPSVMQLANLGLALSLNYSAETGDVVGSVEVSGMAEVDCETEPMSVPSDDTPIEPLDPAEPQRSPGVEASCVALHVLVSGQVRSR